MGAKKIKPSVKKPQKVVLPDSTISEQVREWLDKNFTVVVGLGAAILFMISVTVGYGAYERSQQERARSDYAVLASKFPAEGKGMPADWEKVVPDLQKFISEHGKSIPAVNARVELAKAFFQMKRYDEAAKTASEALELAPKDHFLQPLIRYQLAYAYEAAGKADKAIEEWTQLKNLGAGELEREADWNLGRLYEARNDKAKAAEMYQLAMKAQGDYPPAALLAQELVRVKPGESPPSK